MIVIDYLLLLFLNLIIEIGVAHLLGYRTKEKILLIIIINFVTHPLLCYFLWISVCLNININNIVIFILEVVVIFIESFLLYFVIEKQYFNKLGLSLCINAASFFLGLFFQNILR